MTARRKRGTHREPHGRLFLQQQDETGARFVGRSGVCELQPIALVCRGETASGYSACARRFRDLTDHGLIETHARTPYERNRYTLTEKGAAYFGSHDDEGMVLRPNIRPFSQSADHLVAVSRVWALLATRLSRPGAPRLSRFITEGETRRVLGKHTRGALIPDGIAIVGPVVFGIEVDFSQERRGVFRAKLAKYRRHLNDGAPLFGLGLSAVLVFANSLQRLAALAAAASEEKLQHAVFFQSLEHVSVSTIVDCLATVDSLAEAVRTGSDPFTQSLLGGPHA